MNDSLVELLEPLAQHAPKFNFDFDRHHKCLTRSSDAIEDLFGPKAEPSESHWFSLRSMSTLTRQTSKESNGNSASYSSTNRRDMDEKPQPVPPVAYGQRQDSPAGLMVFSCAAEDTTTSWPEPEVADRTFDRELAT
eukprot:CAMPEP_0172891648 /NCGR_PEP_ID=MMETSP1075-20121228/144326_1 /TAXON_ID=2916 /ORGANISM="Ceratium fusus, Strain PA161109" /LENGTH=136 /DNA_ID=CAMNT_0013746145 /DNA_START=1 /DNA_END=407 /DNA_ORIENTATION=-